MDSKKNNNKKEVDFTDKVKKKDNNTNAERNNENGLEETGGLLVERPSLSRFFQISTILSAGGVFSFFVCGVALGPMFFIGCGVFFITGVGCFGGMIATDGNSNKAIRNIAPIDSNVSEKYENKKEEKKIQDNKKKNKYNSYEKKKQNPTRFEKKRDEQKNEKKKQNKEENMDDTREESKIEKDEKKEEENNIDDKNNSEPSKTIEDINKEENKELGINI